MQQEVRVLDALGNALEGQERAAVVGLKEILQLDLVDVGVDGQCKSPMENLLLVFTMAASLSSKHDKNCEADPPTAR